MLGVLECQGACQEVHSWLPVELVLFVKPSVPGTATVQRCWRDASPSSFWLKPLPAFPAFRVCRQARPAWHGCVRH
eukprot:1889758-Amphidinium_carterae.1